MVALDETNTDPADPADPPAVARRTPTPLRGREPERTRLDRFCADLATGGSGPWWWVIEGEAGLGKTRLLAELAALAAGYGVAMATAGCDPIANDRPFGPLLEALGCTRDSPDARRRSLAERCTRLSTTDRDRFGPHAGRVESGARFGIQDDLVDLAVDEADGAPVLLVIDDSQWLDPATTSGLAALARRRAGRPLGFVLATRPESRPAEFETLLDRWREHIEWLRLAPVADAAALDLAADVLGRAPSPRLTAELTRAGGNPFSIVALARGFDEQHPAAFDGVRSSVLGRVGRLGDHATNLLSIAAVLGTGFTPEHLAVLSGVPPFQVFDVLYGAARAGLLTSSGTEFAFSHALVADQLTAQVPAPLLASIHRSIVQKADELGIGAATIAHHVMAAPLPDDPRTIDALCRAATEVSAHDPQLALTYLDRAAELCGPRCDRGSELALRRATVLCSIKRVAEARAALEHAIGGAHDPERIAELLSARARCAHLLGDLTTAADEFEHLARSGALDAAAQAAAWADVATYRFWLMQGTRPWAEAARAIELADRSGAVAAGVQAIAAQAAMAAFDGDVARGVELAALATARGRLLPHDLVIPSPAFTEGLARMLADDLSGAIDVLQRDRLRIERLGDPVLAGRPATALVMAMYLAGRWDDGLAEASAIAGLCADTDTFVGRLVAPVITGLVAHHRGDRSTSTAALAEAGSIEGNTEAYAVPFLLQLQALHLEEHGQPDAALGVLNDTIAAVRALVPAIRTWFVLDAVRLVLSGVAATPEVVDGWLDGLLVDAARTGLPGTMAFAAIAHGAIRDDIEQVLAAVEPCTRSPHAITRATALEVAALACQRAGRAHDARRLADAAQAAFDQLGATTGAARVARRRGEGAGRRAGRTARPRFGWEALTPAELAVLELVSIGLRNGEIAEQLLLSKRTVESHMASMLLKLGVTTRVELVVEAARHRDRG